MADQQAQGAQQSTAQTLEAASTQEIMAAVIKATESRSLEVQKFELHQRQARLFALSGLFADIKGQSQEQALAQAFVKIDLGDGMGLSPAEAMTGIDLIQGRVAISANIRAARMQRAGYEWDLLQLDDKGCRLQLRFKGQLLMREEVDEKTGEITTVPAVISFTAEDANRAGLLGKDNYKKNPRNMFFARAITNAQRWYAPGILSLNILSTEEAIDVPVDDDGKSAIDISGTRTETVRQAVAHRKQRQQATSATTMPQQDAQPADNAPWARGDAPQAQVDTQAQQQKAAQQEQAAQAQQTAQQAEPRQDGLW